MIYAIRWIMCSTQHKWHNGDSDACGQFQNLYFSCLFNSKMVTTIPTEKRKTGEIWMSEYCQTREKKYVYVNFIDLYPVQSFHWSHNFICAHTHLRGPNITKEMSCCCVPPINKIEHKSGKPAIKFEHIELMFNIGDNISY